MADLDEDRVRRRAAAVARRRVHARRRVAAEGAGGAVGVRRLRARRARDRRARAVGGAGRGAVDDGVARGAFAGPRVPEGVEVGADEHGRRRVVRRHLAAVPARQRHRVEVRVRGALARRLRRDVHRRGRVVGPGDGDEAGEEQRQPPVHRVGALPLKMGSAASCRVQANDLVRGIRRRERRERACDLARTPRRVLTLRRCALVATDPPGRIPRTSRANKPNARRRGPASESGDA